MGAWRAIGVKAIAAFTSRYLSPDSLPYKVVPVSSSYPLAPSNPTFELLGAIALPLLLAIAVRFLPSGLCYHLGNADGMGLMVQADGDSRESLEKQLSKVRRVLQILQEQKAGFGMRFPPDLQLEIEEQQKKVAGLEQAIAGLKPEPEAEREYPSGTMPPDSPFYVGREALEEECRVQIEQPGGLLRIRAPRQMGKSSFMARIRHFVQEERGYRSASLSFQELPEVVLQDLDRLLLRLCSKVAGQVGPGAAAARQYWQDVPGDAMEKSDEYLEELLLRVKSPVLLVLDEVDRVFPYTEVAVAFLGLLRAWREKGVTEDPWTKLRMVLVYSTEVYVQMPVSVSPFNVGFPVELEEFTPAQVLDLAGRHGLSEWREEMEVRLLRGLVGGHPYLVRLALYHLVRGM